MDNVSKIADPMRHMRGNSGRTASGIKTTSCTPNSNGYISATTYRAQAQPTARPLRIY